jgi:hypothetical protein
MKQLISTLWFVLIFSSAALAQTQIITKDPILAGCKVFIEDGLLYGVCNGEGVVEQEPVVKPVVKKRSLPAPKRKKQEVKWTCVVGPCDF